MASEEMVSSKKTQVNGESKKRKVFFLENWHIITIYLMVYDCLAVIGAYFLALWLRFDCRFSEIPSEYLTAWLKFAPIYAVFSLVIFWILHLYHSLWRFASFTELRRTTLASLITAVFHTALITIIFRRMPISYYIIGAAIQFALVLLCALLIVLSFWNATKEQEICEMLWQAESCLSEQVRQGSLFCVT